MAPFSILYCKKREHGQTRAPFSEIKANLEKYLGKLGTAIVDSSIIYAVNFMYQIHSLEPVTANAADGSHEMNLKVPAPTIDSETGERVKCNKDHQIIPEIKEHSFYLMQTLRIGNSECLTFFDPGANTHLVDGNLAEREGLQMISDKTSAIRVVGGSEIKTEHSVYQFNLGPGEENVYHEIVAIGMSSVTSEFAKYDLSDICKEYKDEAVEKDIQTILPKSIGGSKVHLLLGIIKYKTSSNTG